MPGFDTIHLSLKWLPVDGDMEQAKQLMEQVANLKTNITLLLNDLPGPPRHRGRRAGSLAGARSRPRSRRQEWPSSSSSSARHRQVGRRLPLRLDRRLRRRDQLPRAGGRASRATTRRTTATRRSTSSWTRPAPPRTTTRATTSTRRSSRSCSATTATCRSPRSTGTRPRTRSGSRSGDLLRASSAVSTSAGRGPRVARYLQRDRGHSPPDPECGPVRCRVREVGRDEVHHQASVWTIPVILLVIFMTFILMRQIAGQPVRTSERAIPAEIQRNLERKFGLDKLWHEQYLQYVKNVVTFDPDPRSSSATGTGTTSSRSTSRCRPSSAPLPSRLLRRPHRRRIRLRANSWGRSHRHVRLQRGLRLTELPRRDAADLLLRPAMGRRSADERLGHLAEQDPAGDRLRRHPWRLARLVRGTMLETLQQDYIRTARAKGLRWRRVVGLHVLRNSMIPVITAKLADARLPHHRLVRDRADLRDPGHRSAITCYCGHCPRLLSRHGIHCPARDHRHRREHGCRHPLRLPRSADEGRPNVTAA